MLQCIMLLVEEQEGPPAFECTVATIPQKRNQTKPW